MNDDIIETNPKSLENSISDKKGLRPVILRMRTGARIAATKTRIGAAQVGNGDNMHEWAVSGAVLIQPLRNHMVKVKKAVERLDCDEGFANMA